MEFKVGHLIYSKGVMLRVIGTGESHIEVIEYNSLESNFTVETKIYSKFGNLWYRWGTNGGEQVKLTKVGLIDPTKIPSCVKDFSQIKSFDTIIIKGVPYKRVEETSLPVPEHWVKVYYLKSKAGEAVLHIQEKKRESLYDKGADAQLLNENGTISLTDSDAWTVVKH